MFSNTFSAKLMVLFVRSEKEKKSGEMKSVQMVAGTGRASQAAGGQVPGAS